MIWYFSSKRGMNLRQRVWASMNAQNSFVKDNCRFCSGAVENWRVWWLALPSLRYSEKHIGLGTKKFVDSLGGC